MIDKKSLGQKGEDIACKALEKDASINGVASQLLTFIFSLCQMLRPDPDLLTVARRLRREEGCLHRWR